MKYKDLPPDIQELVKKRTINPIEIHSDSELGHLFFWDDTPEGHDYWSAVDLGKFSKTDPIVEEVRSDLHKRSQLGMKKYGVGLDRTDLSLKDFLNHQYEELLDAALYCKRAIKELEEIKPQETLYGYPVVNNNNQEPITDDMVNIGEIESKMKDLADQYETDPSVVQELAKTAIEVSKRKSYFQRPTLSVDQLLSNNSDEDFYPDRD